MRKLFVLLVSLLSVSILTSCYNLKKDYDRGLLFFDLYGKILIVLRAWRNWQTRQT